MKRAHNTSFQYLHIPSLLIGEEKTYKWVKKAQAVKFQMTFRKKQPFHKLHESLIHKQFLNGVLVKN